MHGTQNITFRIEDVLSVQFSSILIPFFPLERKGPALHRLCADVQKVCVLVSERHTLKVFGCSGVGY
jgi:hypothetical protein